MNRNDEQICRPWASAMIRALFACIICTLIGGLPLSASAGDAGAGPAPSPGTGHGEPAVLAEGDKRAAARVNGVEISMDSVVAMMYRINAKKIRNGETADPMEDVRKEALRRLIMQELVYQKAKAEGIKADEEAVAAELSNVKKKMGGEEKFREFLEKSRMTEEGLRASAERKIILETIAEKKVTSKIAISEEDVQKEYEKNKEAYETHEKILITNVVFFLNTGDEENVKKAEAVLDAIKADKGANPWSLKPDGTFVIRDLEVKQDEEPELYAASKNLKPGELSGVLKTSDSLQIIKLLEYKPFVRVPFEQAKASIEKKLREEAMQKRMGEWEAELQKDATIEILKTSGE